MPLETVCTAGVSPAKTETPARALPAGTLALQTGNMMPLEFSDFHDIVLEAPFPAMWRKNQLNGFAILFG